MIRINDQDVETIADEFGVRFDDSFVVVHDYEEDARTTRQMTGGEIVCRRVYFTEWELVSE